MASSIGLPASANTRFRVWEVAQASAWTFEGGAPPHVMVRRNGWLRSVRRTLVVDAAIVCAQRSLDSGLLTMGIVAGPRSKAFGLRNVGVVRV